MKKILLMLILLGMTSAFPQYNTIVIDEGISESLAIKMKDMMDLYHVSLPEGTPIEIIISSPGGSVFAGFTIINTILAIQAKGRAVNITVDRFCASMCFAILQSATVRRAYPLGVLMQHKSAGGNRDILDALDAQIEKFEAARININPIIWRYITKANIWVSPEEALNWNIIDKIVYPEVLDLRPAVEEEDDRNDKSE